MNVIASRREGGCMIGLNMVSPSFSPQCSATKILAEVQAVRHPVGSSSIYQRAGVRLESRIGYA
jgi:hypothetical protein